MKIYFLVRWFPPKIDGIGDYTWNLACALRDYGVDARIFTSEGQEGLKGTLKEGWILPIIKQWQPDAIMKTLNALADTPDWFSFQFIPQLYGRGCIAWQVPEILKGLKKRFKCRITVTFHEFAAGWSLNPKHLFLAPFTRLQAWYILSVIDSAVTTCVRYEEILRSLSGNRLPIEVIPVGSNIKPSFINPEELKTLRSKIFPEGSKVLGLFGALSTFKNFPLAIKVLHGARQERLNAWLYLIGNTKSSNPKLFKELMCLADKLSVRPYIVKSGELSNQDISIHLQMVDMFLFTQINGISTRNTTLMAALAHGLPVVSFTPERGLFDNFNIPCRTLVHNEEDFIKATVDCIKGGNCWSEYAWSNRDYFYSHFSWPVIAQQYLKALRG